MSLPLDSWEALTDTFGRFRVEVETGDERHVCIVVRPLVAWYCTEGPYAPTWADLSAAQETELFGAYEWGVNVSARFYLAADRHLRREGSHRPCKAREVGSFLDVEKTPADADWWSGYVYLQVPAYDEDEWLSWVAGQLPVLSSVVSL